MADIGSTTSTGGRVNFTSQGFASTISPAGDHDWFRAALQGGRTSQITNSNAGGSSGLSDPTITVRDSNGAFLAFDDDGGPGLDSRLLFTPPSDGFYFLDAGGFGSSTGNYRVRLRDPGTGVDAPAGPNTNFRVNVGSSSTGAIQNTFDVDWVRVRLQAGRRYNFAMSDTSGGNLDPILLLRTPTSGLTGERQVRLDDDSGPGLDSFIGGYRATRTGDHFLVASSFANGSSGSYRISASVA